MSNDKPFEWNDKLILEFTDKLQWYFSLGHSKKSALQTFIASKTKKEDKEWEVLEGWHKHNEGDNPHPYGTACDEFCNIHSVKRLSDNEVFSVGDEVEFCWGHRSTMKIGGFTITKRDGLRVQSDPCNYYVGIEDIKTLPPKPKPFFITEDGKAIDSDHNVWYVFTDETPKENAGYNCKWTPQYSKAGDRYNCGNNYYKVFSTQAAAEYYILMNKPCLSFSEAIMLFRSNPSGPFEIYCKNELLKLTKQKLGL